MIIERESSKEPLIYGNARWKVTTAPSVEPVTVPELKLFARIDHDDEDTILDNFIKAAREATEIYLRKALITQTITLYLDEWHSSSLELPRPPLLSVTSISLLDESGTETTYSSDNYYIDTSEDFGRIIIKQNATPPYNSDRYHAGYKIVYTAGYGQAASDVPESIRQCIMLWATSIYENRAFTKDPPPEAVEMLSRYRAVML